MLKKDDKDIKLCPKVNVSSISVTGAARQKVRPAAQLLSARVAHALVRLSDESSRDVNQKLSKFISTVDKWFDVMNSREATNNLKKWKSGYGQTLEIQDAVLD